MRFFFTEEDNLTRVRGSEIRAALVHARHDVIRGSIGDTAPAGTDVWFHGIGVHGAPPLDERVVRPLLDSSAQIVLFQLCDHDTMSFDRIPPALAARARVFLRNHWPRDSSHVPEPFRQRTGFLPPMLKAMRPRAGEALAERPGSSIFFGTRTGFSNLGHGRNAREETVRAMRASGLPFRGGISPHAEVRYHTAPELLVPRMSEREHTRLLGSSKICLAPWGNHPLTYRLFEGMALRCLVVAQPLRNVSFLDSGLEPGRHYAEVAPDLGDLTEVVRYYLSHVEEAQRIADAGHAHFRRFLASRGPLVSEWLFEETVGSWHGIYRPSLERSPFLAARALTARLFPRRF